MKKIFYILLLQGFNIIISGQSVNDSSLIIELNQQIDDHVVQKNVAILEKLYADDFVFSHGSGRVEGRQGWLGSVAKGNFISRKHDSVTVELHPQLAIARGKLTVQKRNKEKTDQYYLFYIRVYAYRQNGWQLISHITTHEFHLSSL